MSGDLGWTLTEEDRQLFLAEAEELVQALESGALALERGGTDGDVLQVMFRAAHTLKGNAGLIGQEGLAQHMHQLEQTFDDLRSGRAAVTPALVQQVLSGIDRMRGMLAQFAQGVSPGLPEAPRGEIAPAGQKAAASADLVPCEPQVPPSPGEDARSEGAGRYLVKLQVDPTCAMPAVRLFQAYQGLAHTGQIEHAEPQQETLNQFQGREAQVIVRLQRPDDVREALEGVSEISVLSVGPADAPASAPSAAADAERDAQATTTTVRVRVELLDHLMNLVGELVLDRTRVADLVSRLEREQGGDTEEVRQELGRSSLHLGRVTLDLQETVMKARMLPIEHLFRRFPRLVRDLAARSGKRIDFEMSGLDTELDRMVMDELGDPLTHLLRNAVDHGVETPLQRIAKGKAESGRIALRAATEEGYVVIELRDDGGGIDPEKVRRAALERGVVTPEQAERMTAREAQELIFAPGFSTAEKLTEISGRGVGLDAVRASLEKLSGMVDLQTEIGVGTTFRLRIPLTLAIMRALLVRVADEIYALPLSAVRQIVKIGDKNVQRAHGRSLLADRGELIGLHSLSSLYDCPVPGEEPFAVVVGSGGQQVALSVGGLLGEQEIVLKAFGDFLGAVPGLIGATILGSGQLALVTDVRYFLHGREAS